MGKPKRQPTTIYLDPSLKAAAKIKAALSGLRVSDVVNEALARDLRQDEADLRLVAERRRKGKVRPYEDFLRDLKRDGLI